MVRDYNKSIDRFLIKKFIFYGLHLGSLKRFLNPTMKVYMVGFRNGFCVLNLNLVYRNMKRAFIFLSKIALSGEKILFVGAPKGLENNFISLCNKHGHYFLDSYTGGFFTNYHQYCYRIPEGFLTKRPSVIFIFNVSKNIKVLEEVRLLNIPTMAFVNASHDFRGIDYPIPANIVTWKGSLFAYNIFYYLFLLGDRKLSKKN